jgi:FdhD protein
MIFEPATSLQRLRWRTIDGAEIGERTTAQETPVAIVHDGSATAVMMATPADIEDLGLGLSLSEGILERLEDLRDIELVDCALGVEVRVWLARDCCDRLAARRRRLAGPTGCGLCGIESLAEAVKSPRVIAESNCEVHVTDLLEAMSALNESQPLGQTTRAVHAAGLWQEGRILLVREDVGRHNAFDKLIGAAARTGVKGDVLLLTSRVSVEMVQKVPSSELRSCAPFRRRQRWLFDRRNLPESIS